MPDTSSNVTFKIETGLLVNGTSSLPNTTVTGFINVSSTGQFGGSLNAGNTTIDGFANITSVLSAGNTSVTGFVNVTGVGVFGGTLATGNTTVTGFVNASGVGVFGGTLAAGNTTIDGFANITSVLSTGNTTITGFANVSSTLRAGNTTLDNLLTVAGNAAFDTDLLFLDAVNNLIGLKNAAPSAIDLVTINGNVVFNAVNTGIRITTSNATHNAAITLAGNTTNTRLTFSTFDNSNSSVKDGGFIFYGVNASASQSLLSFSNAEFLYKTGNVVHAGNFGVYDVNGTRVGP